MEVTLRRENLIGAGLGIVAFSVYILTVCRFVGYTDSGELASVVCTLGIAHPTGYPLFTLLGRCWVMMPLPWEEILRLNLFSAALVSIATGLFFKTSVALGRAAKSFALRSGSLREWNGTHLEAASAIASLTLAFSTTFWSQSSSLEVYALHLVLILLTAWAFISGLENQLRNPQTISRYLICFAFVLGLSFANHMTTVLLAPGFLWLYFRSFGIGKESFARLGLLIPFFLAGLSIYMYLPLRASAHPLLNWGNPDALERFLWHITGKQYRVWMFSGWEVVAKQFKYYFTNFPAEFNAVAILFALIGLVEVWRQSRRMMMFLLLLFCSTILYAVNYDIFDIDSYFLLSYIVVGWIIAFGISAAIGFADRKGWKSAFVVAILFALPVVQLVYHWKDVEETESALPSQFTTRTFAELEPNAVVISTQWDYFISPALYYHFVLGQRSDLTIIDKSLLQDRSWYFDVLERQAPWLMDRLGDSKRAFLVELRKFEHNEPFDFRVIQERWQALLADLVAKAISDHPVYIDARIDREFPLYYQRTPEGFFLRVLKVDSASDFREVANPIAKLNPKNPVARDFEQYYVLIRLYDAEWLIRHKEIAKARGCLEEVMKMAPGNRAAKWMWDRLPK